MGKTHQVLFQQHFTVAVALSKDASVYEAAIKLRALKKKNEGNLYRCYRWRYFS